MTRGSVHDIQFLLNKNTAEQKIQLKSSSGDQFVNFPSKVKQCQGQKDVMSGLTVQKVQNVFAGLLEQAQFFVHSSE